ncbi:KH domain-containing, RNA-binding, signal transduction-associated protein 3 [Tupaia chinensis]|uniref:KH domain-containing, RNA-binding, signal transduction-associated protein 3 n=1 Tax=Tupaia chinensis TaxID=246437 RepID=L9KQN0_TUPCH|nr:KH domain-containing, RNA-binding, signal transduction-associated protein 3 [Tupaia chinensis]
MGSTQPGPGIRELTGKEKAKLSSDTCQGAAYEVGEWKEVQTQETILGQGFNSEKPNHLSDSLAQAQSALFCKTKKNSGDMVVKARALFLSTSVFWSPCHTPNRGGHTSVTGQTVMMQVLEDRTGTGPGLGGRGGVTARPVAVGVPRGTPAPRGVLSTRGPVSRGRGLLTPRARGAPPTGYRPPPPPPTQETYGEYVLPLTQLEFPALSPFSVASRSLPYPQTLAMERHCVNSKD